MFFQNSANEPRRDRTHPGDVRIANISDADLARSARDGDRAAFETLLDRFLPRVRAFLYHLSGSKGDPDDLAQEVFLIVVRGFSELREPEHVGSWIFGIAYKIFRGRNRKFTITKSDGGADETDALPSKDKNPSDALLTTEERVLVTSAIERLSERHREVFLLRHVEDLPAGDVARILEIPEGSVRRMDFEARERLREILTPKVLYESKEHTK